MINLFINTRKLTPSKEDHLTEFIAAALQLNEAFRTAYRSLLLNAFAPGQRQPYPAITDVSTQVRFDGSGCIPDMLLTLQDGRRIICEHKIEADETAGPESDSRGQLERYLALPADGVAYFRAEFKNVPPAVLNHPGYIRPPHAPHFLWRDLYPLLEKNPDPFIGWMREAFEGLGYTPPINFIGDLNAADAAERQRNRRNFAKFWTPLISLAHRLNWKTEPGSIAELYLTSANHALVRMIFISPVRSRRFLIRFTPVRPRLAGRLKEKLSAAGEIFPFTEVAERTITRAGRKVAVVDVRASLQNILGKNPAGTEMIEEKLFRYVSRFLLAAVSDRRPEKAIPGTPASDH